MADLRDVLAYILQRYPNPGDLSNARVTKMIYLADWRHVLEAGHQLSSIHWVFDHYGPFVWDVIATVRENPDLFASEDTVTRFGNRKVILSCVDDAYKPRLSNTERQAIDHVMHVTAPLDWQRFIGLVYSTHPVVSSERYSDLDLVTAAEDYKRSPVYKSVRPK